MFSCWYLDLVLSQSGSQRPSLWPGAHSSGHLNGQQLLKSGNNERQQGEHGSSRWPLFICCPLLTLIGETREMEIELQIMWRRPPEGEAKISIYCPWAKQVSITRFRFIYAGAILNKALGSFFFFFFITQSKAPLLCVLFMTSSPHVTQHDLEHGSGFNCVWGLESRVL